MSTTAEPDGRVAALKNPALRPDGFEHPAGDIEISAVGGLRADTNVGEPGCATVDSWEHWSCIFWCTDVGAQ